VRNAYCVFAVFTPDRPTVTEHLRANEVQFSIHYPVPIHLMEAHADLGHRAGDFPQAEAAAEKVLCLPIYPEMPSEHVETVCSVLRSAGQVKERAARSEQH
jgi:dTDP-4-amino-4,6-dideoxygalactose transaminase